MRYNHNISNNAYSGLNSLRGGLKHSYWGGSSLLDATTFQSESGKPSCNYTASPNMQSGYQDTLAMGSLFFSYADGECIAAPIYFFFAFNTTHLKDTSQKLNLDKLTRVAKKYSLSVRVTDVADSSTGTSSVNDSSSISRACFVSATRSERRTSWRLTCTGTSRRRTYTLRSSPSSRESASAGKGRSRRRSDTARSRPAP